MNNGFLPVSRAEMELAAAHLLRFVMQTPSGKG